MKITNVLAVTLLLGVLIAPVSHAALVVSNLSEPDEAFSTTIGPLGESAVAQSFSTPSTGPGWTLDSLTFALSAEGSVPDPLAVQVYSSSSGAPGALLGTLSGPDPSGSSTANYTYTPTATIALAPNTSYFAVLSGPSSAAPVFFYDWRNTSSPSETGDPGWSIADSALFQTTGGTWTTDTSRLKIAVNATAVPEPSSFALLGLGGLALLRRRR